MEAKLVTMFLNNDSILHSETRNGCSYVWKSIVKAVGHLQFGFKVRVGRGNVSLWYDRLLDEGIICDLIPFLSIQDTDMKLKEVWYDTGWQFDRLVTLLPLSIKLKIRSLFIHSGHDDVLICGAAIDGSYSTKSAYNLWSSSGNCTAYSQGLL